MSAFLGKIHYWLHNKIRYSEQMEESIIKWAKEKENLPVEQWQTDIVGKYGAPLGDEPLEEIIDTSNIHGWLQDKISRAELRQAALITNIINVSEEYIKDLKELFRQDGFMKGAFANEKYPISTPEDVYKVLNEYVLEGMPCDPIDRRIESSEEVYKWLTSYCIHEQYWNEIGGDIKNFYVLREAWVTAFVDGLNRGFAYEAENVEGKRLNIIKKTA
jgi:hypothetical protein